MLHVLGAYLGVVGGVTAGAQVARGAVRGAARLARGDARGALVEIAGGVTAPVVTAVNQLTHLGQDVCRSVGLLTAEACAQAGGAATPSRSRAARRQQGVPPATANSAA